MTQKDIFEQNKKTKLLQKEYIEVNVLCFNCLCGKMAIVNLFRFAWMGWWKPSNSL